MELSVLNLLGCCFSSLWQIYELTACADIQNNKRYQQKYLEKSEEEFSLGNSETSFEF